MNATSTESPGANHERGSLAYLLGAVALIVVVGVLVMVFGVVHPPALPSIGAAGVTPPAGVAWTQWNDRDNCTALMVARPDGRVNRLACEQDGGDVLAWTRDGIVTLTWVSSGTTLVTRDATTGDVVSRTPGAIDYAGRPTSGVSTDRRDGTLVVTLDPGGRELWRVEAPSGYDVRAGALSPDGAWVAMTDSADRLLLERVGATSPAVWTGAASGTSSAPVWEGMPIPAAATDPSTRK